MPEPELPASRPRSLADTAAVAPRMMSGQFPDEILDPVAPRMMSGQFPDERGAGEVNGAR